MFVCLFVGFGGDPGASRTWPLDQIAYTRTRSARALDSTRTDRPTDSPAASLRCLQVSVLMRGMGNAFGLHLTTAQVPTEPHCARLALGHRGGRAVRWLGASTAVAGNAPSVSLTAAAEPWHTRSCRLGPRMPSKSLMSTGQQVAERLTSGSDAGAMMLPCGCVLCFEPVRWQ